MDGDCTEDRVTILAKNVKPIDRVLKIVHKGNQYEIMVKEETKQWKPGFISDPSEEVNSHAEKVNDNHGVPPENSNKHGSENSNGSGREKREFRPEDVRSPVHGNLGSQPMSVDSPEKIFELSEENRNNDTNGNINMGNDNGGGPAVIGGTSKSHQEQNNNGPGHYSGLKEFGPRQINVGPELFEIGQDETEYNRLAGSQKRKRGDPFLISAETLNGQVNLNSPPMENKILQTKKPKLKFDLNKKGRKKGKRVPTKEVEDEIQSWANETTKENNEDEDWFEDEDSVNIFPPVSEANADKHQLSEEEIVKETLDTMGMGEKLGINLKDAADQIEELVMERVNKDNLQ